MYIVSIIKYTTVLTILGIIYATSYTWKDFYVGMGYFIFMSIIYNICVSTLTSTADASPPFEPRGNSEDDLDTETMARLRIELAKSQGTDAMNRFFNQGSDWFNRRDGPTGDFSWIETFQSTARPPYKLPPGFTDINYKFKNKKKPIWGADKYCEENPTCYPCSGWTDIGTPKCIG